MAATLHKLETDPRLAPARCLLQMVEDIEAGRVKPRRIVIVVDDEENENVAIRAAGPGMDYLPTAVGLLFTAAHDLVEAGRK